MVYYSHFFHGENITVFKNIPDSEVNNYNLYFFSSAKCGHAFMHIRMFIRMIAWEAVIKKNKVNNCKIYRKKLTVIFY